VTPGGHSAAEVAACFQSYRTLGCTLDRRRRQIATLDRCYTNDLDRRVAPRVRWRLPVLADSAVRRTPPRGIRAKSTIAHRLQTRAVGTRCLRPRQRQQTEPSSLTTSFFRAPPSQRTIGARTGVEECGHQKTQRRARSFKIVIISAREAESADSDSRARGRPLVTGRDRPNTFPRHRAHSPIARWGAGSSV